MNKNALAGFVLLFVSILSLKAQECIYFNGFEDGGVQFTDQIALDTIFSIDYYSVGEGSNGSHDNATVASWTVEYSKDTLIELCNVVSPLVHRGDSWEVVEDIDGSNKAEIEALGGDGGDYFFKYVAGSETTSNCNNYEADLNLRAVPIQEHNSYRVSYYIKTVDDAQVDVELMRGWYNSQKPFSMSGASGSGEHTSVISEFPDNIWTRVTYMTYYTTDSIADLFFHSSGYWWSSSWYAEDPVTGKVYNQIKQPDTYFLRFSFQTPSKTYLVDDIAVYNSWIGGAEYNGNIIRIDFGYETNMAKLVKATGKCAIILPAEAFNITGIDAAYSDEPIEIPVKAAEYHNDGYMYIFPLDDCSYYEDIRIDFFNPTDEAMQLKYTGSLYPMADDAEWVKAGKIVPDFKNEFVLYNPGVSATPWAEVAPTLLTTDPDDGSFNLDATKVRSFKAYFDKDIYAVEGACESNPEGVLAKIVGSGVDEYLITSEYDAENYAVTFTFPESVPTNLYGDYEFLILNARAQETSVPGREVSVTVSYAIADTTAPVWYIKTDFASLGERKIPAGFTVYGGGFGDGNIAAGSATDAIDSNNSRTMLFKETDQIYGCFYLCPRGGTEAILTYGEVEGAALHLTPGEYVLSFYYTGFEIAMPTFTTIMYKLGDSENTIMKVKSTPTAVYYRASSASYIPVTDVDYFKQIITVTEEADYVIAWDATGNGWSGVALGDIKFSNKYSSAYQSIASFNVAYQNCVNKQTEVKAAIANYGGDAADTFDALIAKYDGWSNTSPKVYSEVVAELKAGLAVMQTRIDQVDKFYADFAAAYALDSTYAVEDENALVAYTALDQVYEQYKNLSCPSKNAVELAEIITAIENATAALNNRIAAMELFENNIGNCEDIFENYAALSTLAEFQAVQNAYNENNNVDLIACTDEELAAANNAIETAVNAFNALMSNANTLTKQLKGLSALAAVVEATFGEKSLADIDAILAATIVDDQELASVYKKAIKEAMNNKLSEGADLSGTDMTSFIQNPIFYTYATTPLIANNEEGKAFPGWTVLATSGNAYVENGWTSFDGSLTNHQIGFDWNSSVTIQQTLTDLPAGQYTFGFSTSAWGTLDASTTTGGFYFTQIDANGEIMAVDSFKTWWDDRTFTFNVFGGDVILTADLGTTSTWCFVDNFTLSFNHKLDGVDYSKFNENPVTHEAYENAVYTNDIRIGRNSRQIQLPVYLKNSSSICGFEADLHLPAGFSVKYEYDADEDEYSWGISKGERMNTEHSINCSQLANGDYHLLSADLYGNKAYYDSDDKKNLPVAYITLEIADSVSVGNYKLQLRNILLNHNENSTITEYNVPNTYSAIDMLYSVIAVPNYISYGDIVINSDNCSDGLVNSGAKVTLTAVSAPHYHFNCWKDESGNVVSYSNPMTFYANGNVYYTAEFAIDRFLVGFKDYDGSTISWRYYDWNSEISTPDDPSRPGYVFVGWDSTPLEFVPDYNVTYTAQYVLLGDVTLNDKVNLTDLTTLVNYIMADAQPEMRVFKASDVNADESLNLTDLTTIVNIIMSGGNKAPLRHSESGGFELSVDCGVTTNPDFSNLQFSIDGTGYSGIQFDLSLPDELVIQGMELSDMLSLSPAQANSHSLSVSQLDNGMYRVLLYSFENKTIANKNNLLSIVVNNVAGSHEVVIENLCAVKPDADTFEADILTYNVDMSGATGIQPVGLNGIESGMYLLNGMKADSGLKGVMIKDGRKLLTK